MVATASSLGQQADGLHLGQIAGIGNGFAGEAGENLLHRRQLLLGAGSAAAAAGLITPGRLLAQEAISVAGIFLNRKNVILLLMCIELMLLSVNLNFIAFSHFLGDISGQVFVFFILTVAAAEAAIGLAILVVLFRTRRSINVQELNRMKG